MKNKRSKKVSNKTLASQLISIASIIICVLLLYAITVTAYTYSNNDKEIDTTVNEIIDTIEVTTIPTEEPEVISTPDVTEDEILPEWSGQGEFKSYMDYTKITDKSSAQYKLQQTAWTNNEGIRCIDDYRMIAVGFGHGLVVGDKVIVSLTTGEQFLAIIGEEKDIKDTLDDRVVHNRDGSIIEFIVDENMIDPYIRQTGSFGYLSQFEGGIKNIKKIE